MKKLVVFCLTLLVIMSVGVTAFAAPATFVSSPEGNKAPRLISFKVDSEECEADFKTTSYNDRSSLSTANKQTIEGAYDSIKNASDITTLNSDLAALAKKSNLTGKKLAVSDLFDITISGCESAEHSAHGITTFTLEADTLNNFVGVMHYSDGKWELIEGAEVSGKTVTFKVDSFATFAFVVSKEALSPETGDASAYLPAIIMLVSAVAALVCYGKLRKVNA